MKKDNCSKVPRSCGLWLTPEEEVLLKDFREILPEGKRNIKECLAQTLIEMPAEEDEDEL